MHKLLRTWVLLFALGLLSTAWGQEETFTLNLKDADIDALISTVAKKTGKNFVIDPRVKAKVTVISNQEMDADELYSVFLSVLQVHGYSVVPAGDIIKILPDVNAKQGPVPTVSGRGKLGDELVTQVIPIRNVAASQLVPILRPLVPQQGHLAAYAGSNIIVITDRASNIKRLAGIISRIDRPDNDEIEFIKLSHASAAEVVRILNSLQQKSATKGGATPDAPQLASDDRTNSVLVSGSKAARARMGALIASLDSPLEQGGNTKVVYLKYAKAKDIADILKGVNEGQKKAAQAGSAKQTKGTPSAASKEVDIQADEETNALVITAAPDAMKNIEAVIRQLDIRRAQVHVEAIIVEVSGNLDKELGFSYLFGKKMGQTGSNSTPPVGGALLGNAGSSLSAIGAAIASGEVSSNTIAQGLGSGFTLGFGNKASNGNIFAGILKAVSSNSNTNILSTPSIVTLDNEEAEITVGETRPFQTGNFTTNSSGASNPFTTTEQKDVGLTLKIKPQINEGDTIRLDIEQEASSVNERATNDSTVPGTVTNKRTLKTSIMVEDGQLIVLGGLIQEQKDKTVSKIPLLGDIPLLGRLFQYRSNTKNKTNLMVFLQPSILRDRVSADRKSQEKYTFMRARQLEAGHQAKIVTVDTSILPEIKLYFNESANAGSLSTDVEVMGVAEGAEAVGADAN